MSRATLTFLIALPFQINPTLVSSKKGRDRKKKPKPKKAKVKEIVEEPEKPVDPHFIECDPKMKYFCTIQYKFIPNLDVALSVVCLGKVSKIFLKDQVKVIKNVVRNNIAWVAFSVTHRIKQPKTNQIQKFVLHKCEISFSHNPKDVVTKNMLAFIGIGCGKKNDTLETSDHDFLLKKLLHNSSNQRCKEQELVLDFVYEFPVFGSPILASVLVPTIGHWLNYGEPPQQIEVLWRRSLDDQKQLFYSFKEGEFCENEFEEVSPTVMDEIPKPPVPGKREKQFSLAGNSSLTTLLQAIPCRLHRKKVITQIISSQKILTEMGLPMPVEEIQAQLQQQLKEMKKMKKEKGAQKQQKKKKKKKNEEEGVELPEIQNTTDEKTDGGTENTIVITGEEMVFDSPTWYKEKYKLFFDILYAGVWLTTDTLLTQEARDTYQPLGIRIKKLKNMPIRDPAYRRCKNISIEYSVGTLFKNKEIPPVPVERFSDKVIIDNTQVFLTSSFPPEQLIESFQTSKLFIKIYGYFLDTSETFGALFTQDRGDEFFSKRATTRIAPDFDLDKKYLSGEAMQLENNVDKMEKVFLGSAEVDCKELLCSIYRIDINAPIMSGHILKETITTSNIVDNFNTLNVYDDVNIEKGILDDGKLIENNTTVKVSIKMLGSLKAMMKESLENKKLTRLFVVISETATAGNLLRKIVYHNASVIGKTLLVPCIPFYKGDEIKSDYVINDDENYLEDTELKHLITGFAVDAMETYLFFVEGLIEDITSEVWNKVFSLQTSQGFILYHSELSFSKRLYEDFMTIGGMYIITMGVSLVDLFSDPKIFLEGYIPAPAWRALLSFKNLMMCPSMQDAVQQNLFPSCKELICLDMEFGVPLYKSR